MLTLCPLHATLSLTTHTHSLALACCHLEKCHIKAQLELFLTQGRKWVPINIFLPCWYWNVLYSLNTDSVLIACQAVLGSRD